METFVWDDCFATGLPDVDAQHRCLVDLINELGSALVDGKLEGEALGGVFQRLADYARLHFTEEEALMAEAGIDERAQQIHRRHHEEFNEQVAWMWNARGTGATPGLNLHRFLSAWLGFHILGEDQETARQVREVLAGTSAADAFARSTWHADNAIDTLLRAVDNLYRELTEQSRELAQANALLEQRVAERTQALARANEALEVMSRTDGLLGIANRGHFNRQLALEWRRARRARQPVALLLLDVDHFKRYNDTYGHPAGDRCLQAVSAAARQALRRPADLLARYGGEELVALLPSTDLAGAHAVAEGIFEAIIALRLPHASSSVAPFVTVSIGVACLTPRSGGEPDHLVAAADEALYAAKAAGRARICDA